MGISAISAGITKLAVAAGKSFEFMSHWNTIGDLIRALFGHEPGAESKSKAAKGLYGLFGMKDEREWALLLQKLEGDNEKILVDFTDWQFPREDWADILVALYYGNKFRTFCLTLGNEEERKEFLVRMVTPYRNVISAGGSATDGYRSMRAHLLGRHVPLPPENIDERLREARASLPAQVVRAYDAVSVQFEHAADRINREADTREAEVGRSFTTWFVNLFNFFR